MSKRIIVLDVLVPFRHQKDLEAAPDEKDAFLSKLREAQADPKIRAAWAQLLKDHEVDEILFQARRQNPERPFLHTKTHVARNLKTGSSETLSSSQELAEPGSPQLSRDSKLSATQLRQELIQEHRSGKSQQIVITVHFPKRKKPRREAELAKSVTDFLNRMEAFGWIQTHVRTHGYRAMSARGQEYDDLEAVRHNSVVGFITAALVFVALHQPSISGFSPLSGPPGTSVTITGSWLGGATMVTFNGVSASYNVVNDNEIRATVPGGVTSGPIGVTTAGGIITTTLGTAIGAYNFTVLPPGPTISSLSPDRGPTTTTSVMIAGDHLGGAIEVMFNGKPASFSVTPDAQITATVPAGATTGRVSVRTPDGTAESADPFTVEPAITGFSPPSGRAGDEVHINGTGFVDVTEVKFNGSDAGSFIVPPDTLDTQITATVPAGATTGLISVTTPAGTATSLSPFTVLPPPTITFFSPTSGPAGLKVDIIGTGFVVGAAVKFNGVDAGRVSVTPDIQITAAVPAGSGTGRIKVTTPGGEVESISDFTEE